jgi:hypothetical protein
MKNSTTFLILSTDIDYYHSSHTPQSSEEGKEFAVSARVNCPLSLLGREAGLGETDKAQLWKLHSIELLGELWRADGASWSSFGDFSAEGALFLRRLFRLFAVENPLAFRLLDLVFYFGGSPRLGSSFLEGDFDLLHFALHESVVSYFDIFVATIHFLF